MATEHGNSKPTILFVPGAWFPQSAYDNFLQVASNAGFPTSYALYPSLDPKDPMHADAATDTSFVLEKSLLPLIEADGKDVVIVMHSYGGIPGSGAAKGYGKAARKLAGRKGGVIGLIQISGFVLPEGLSCADGQGGSLPGWIKEDDPSPGLTMPADPVDVFSADIAPELAQANVSQLLPHALLAFKSPASVPAWSEPDFEGRLAYLVCTEDRAIPKFAQEAMMQGSGQRWNVKEFNGSHSAPFMSRAGETVEALENFVQIFLEV